jgi:hypothetical protein
MNILELCDRYGIASKKTLYSRFEAAGIKPHKDSSNKAYCSDDQIAILDDLNRHLKEGGTLRNFTPVSVVTTHTTQEAKQPEPLTYETLAKNEDAALAIKDSDSVVSTTQLITVLTALAEGTAKQTAKNQHDPLRKHEQLEKTVEKGWILTTSEIEEIIGVKPHGESYSRGNWIFKRAGKIGRELGWVVERV